MVRGAAEEGKVVDLAKAIDLAARAGESMAVKLHAAAVKAAKGAPIKPMVVKLNLLPFEGRGLTPSSELALLAALGDFTCGEEEEQAIIRSFQSAGLAKARALFGV